MEFNNSIVGSGWFEENCKTHRMNTYAAMLEELYEKSPYFHEMVNAYSGDDSYSHLKSIEIVIGCIMEDLEKTL